MTPSPAPQTSYVSAHSRGRLTRILLVGGAVCSALIIVVEIGQILAPEFNQGEEIADNPGGYTVLVLYLLLTLLGFVIFVATAIVFLLWLHRSASNLTAFGYWKSQGYSPAWAVGSFFVPIVNLFVPYQATKYVWQKKVVPQILNLFRSQPRHPGSFPPGGAFGWHQTLRPTSTSG